MKIFFINDLYIDTHIRGKKKTNLCAIARFIKKHTLPADVLCIAGNISSKEECVASFLSVASRMFKHVVYVDGELEWTVKPDSKIEAYDKISKIDKYVKTLARPNVVKKITPGGKLLIGNKIFDGTIGFTDQPIDADDSIDKNLRWWTTDYNRLISTELDYLEKVNKNRKADVIVTHFAPRYYINKHEQDKNKYKNNSYLGTRLIYSIKNGGIFHYGRVLSKKKNIIKNRRGNYVMLINNCIGPKPGRGNHGKKTILENGLTKKDFLIEI